LFARALKATKLEARACFASSFRVSILNANEKPVRGPRGERIGPLANLPVFFKLDGKRVVLAGGGAPALWKAELLSATGAAVEVFAPSFDDEFFVLAKAPANGKLLLVERQWRATDLEGASIAIGSFVDDAEAAEFASAAHAAGVPVNVVDKPALCDFQFGAIVNRSPLVIGISTDGAAPVFGQAIRSLIEGLVPGSFALWAAKARDLRRQGSHLTGAPDEKRSFWQRFTDIALQRTGQGPTQSDMDELIAHEPARSSAQPVTFVDVGNDVDTLTLGAIRALRQADDIFFDEDIPAAAMDFARREAQRHSLVRGKTFSATTFEKIVEAAGNGRVVRVRRADEGNRDIDPEVDALRAAGVSIIRFSSGSVR
jgi:uroporphyrin-III C-methyltransferase / precorrin-2 dehydrogenase / sirohydrochlorin ferrochelatase